VDKERLLFQRRHIQARYNPAALIFDKGPALANKLSDSYPQMSRQGDGSQWQLSNSPEFKRLQYSLTQAELNQEEKQDIGAFSRESVKALSIVTEMLDVSAYVRLGLVQVALVPGPPLNESLAVFKDKLFNKNLTSTNAPLTWLSDVAIVLDFKDVHWGGRMQFGPYDADTNKTLFEFKAAPSVKDHVGGFVFWCDFWKSGALPITEVSRFIAEATEHTTGMIEHVMGIVGGDLE